MLTLPKTEKALAGRLARLVERRREYPRAKQHLALTARERALVLRKTDKRRHLCGGKIRGARFAADHVLAHAADGEHKVDNYLPAHSACNGASWFYSPEEFQWILRMGIWARHQMELGKTTLAREMRAAFLKSEKAIKKGGTEGSSLRSSAGLLREEPEMSRSAHAYNSRGAAFHDGPNRRGMATLNIVLERPEESVLR